MVFVAGTDRTQQVLGSPCDALYLRIIGSSRDGQVVRLAAAKCTIGSAPGCTLRLRAGGVQRVHCLILRGTAGTVARAWAPNTRINGQVFRDQFLLPGDRLSIGPIEMAVLDGEPAEPDTWDDLPASEVQPDEHDEPTAAAPPRRRSLADVRLARGRVRKLVGEVRKLRSRLDDFQRQTQVLSDPRQSRQLADEHERLAARSSRLDLRESAHETRQAELDAQARLLNVAAEELTAARADLERREADAAERAARDGDETERRAHLECRGVELTAQQEELARRQSEIEQARRSLETARADFQRQRNDWTAQTAEAQRQWDEERRAWQAQSAEHAQQNRDSHTALEAQRAELEGQAYELGRREMELAQQETDRQETTESIARARREFDESSAAARAELERLRGDLAAQQAMLDEGRDELAKNEGRLHHQRNEQQRLLSEGELSVAERAASDEATAREQADHLAEFETERHALAAERQAWDVERQQSAAQLARLAAELDELDEREAQLDDTVAAGKQQRDAHAETAQILIERQTELADRQSQLELRKREVDTEHSRIAERAEALERAVDAFEQTRIQFDERCRAREAEWNESATAATPVGDELQAARDEIALLTGALEVLQRDLKVEQEARERQRCDTEARRQEFEALKARHAKCPPLEGEDEEDNARQFTHEHDSPKAPLTTLFGESNERQADEPRGGAAGDEDEDGDDAYEDVELDEEDTVTASSAASTLRQPVLSADDDAPIEDHIAAFLSRMRSANQPPPAPPVDKRRRNKRKSDGRKTNPKDLPVVDLPTSSGELERPAPRPAKSANITAMRELANLRARENIESAGHKRMLNRAHGTIGTALACLIAGFAVLFSAQGIVMRTSAAMIIVVGIFFLVAGLLSAKRVYGTLRGRRPGLRAMLEEVEAEIAAARLESEAEKKP